MFSIIPLYALLLAVVAFWGYSRTKAISERTDPLSAHYLGGRTFGPVYIAGTLFASLYSGFTTVGIPNEVYATGFATVRWIPATIAIVFVGGVMSLRLHHIGKIRNHESPVDFITDRFQSHILRCGVILIQLFAGIVFLSAQVMSARSIFNVLFNLDSDNPIGVIMIFGLMLIFEWTGGLVCVVLTDGIQCVLMVTAVALLAGVVRMHHGRWQDLDVELYPRPEFYQTPSHESQMDMWYFIVSVFGFFASPHLMQRIYAAKDARSLKIGYSVTLIGAWLLHLPMIYVGTMGVQILEDSNIVKPLSPFAELLQVIMNKGTYEMIVGVYVFAAALAGVMSTADSVVIASSQLIMYDLVRPLFPAGTKSQYKQMACVCSLVLVVIASVLGFQWKAGVQQVSSILFGMLLNALPSYLVGLFGSRAFNCHPWTLSLGLVSGCGSLLLKLALLRKPLTIGASLQGIVVNLLVLSVAEVLLRLCSLVVLQWRSTLSFGTRPYWDSPDTLHFGLSKLEADLVHEVMGTGQPSVLSIFFFTGLITLVVPFGPSFVPPLEDGHFLFDPELIDGLPYWVWKLLMTCLAGTISVLVYILRIANVPTINEDKEDALQESAPLKTEQFVSDTHTEPTALSRAMVDTSDLGNSFTRPMNVTYPTKPSSLAARLALVTQTEEEEEEVSGKY